MGLTLTRRENEVVLIGADIAVTVVRIKGNSVQLCIQAPPEVLILRQELAGGQQEDK